MLKGHTNWLREEITLNLSLAIRRVSMADLANIIETLLCGFLIVEHIFLFLIIGFFPCR